MPWFCVCAHLLPRYRLNCVAFRAKGLPVLNVPKKRFIASVRSYVVNAIADPDNALCLTMHAKRMLLSELPRSHSPLIAVAPRR